MNRHIKYLVAFALFLIGWAAASWVAIAAHHPSIEKKRAVVHLVGLPDLAISTEAHFIRHRSVSDVSEVFGLGPALLPYFPSDYIYAPPPYMHAIQEIR